MGIQQTFNLLRIGEQQPGGGGGEDDPTEQCHQPGDGSAAEKDVQGAGDDAGVDGKECGGAGAENIEVCVAEGFSSPLCAAPEQGQQRQRGQADAVGDGDGGGGFRIARGTIQADGAEEAGGDEDDGGRPA